MSGQFKIGDRVDYHSYTNGEVVRVGLGTLWVEFQTVHGQCRLPVPLGVARLHAGGRGLCIGRFALRPFAPGKIHIDVTTTGEGGAFDEAALEALIEKFFQKEF